MKRQYVSADVSEFFHTRLVFSENIHHSFEAIYEQLHRNVMLFAVRIIQNCWDMKEVDVLLSRKDGASLTDCQLRLPRLRLALDCRMKNVSSM